MAMLKSPHISNKTKLRPWDTKAVINEMANRTNLGKKADNPIRSQTHNSPIDITVLSLKLIGLSIMFQRFIKQIINLEHVFNITGKKKR